MPTFFFKNEEQRPEGSEPDFLRSLNEPQKNAVRHSDGPLLIIAGAGSGKTRVLTYRIAYLLWNKRANPHQILALTFTNKAAREMQHRIAELIGESARRLWMGTFHSIFSRILRMEADRLGYTRDFSIYDTADSDRLIKNILREMNLNTREIKPQSIRHIISSAKNQLINPQTYREKFVQSSLEDIGVGVYERYIIRCRKNNAMDFDDLLVKPIELFENHPGILRKYQDLFRYILIDEYQDTNHAQYRATRLLAAAHENLCVVGDDAQSIYSFRGADISNILNFRKDYPDAGQIPLEQNFRSTRSILRCADSLIRHNRSRLEKSLWTKNETGDTVTLIENFDERDEAQRIASLIEEQKLRLPASYRDFAVLYRTNYQSRVLEEAFRRKGIPYQLVGGVSFYQRKEVKDVIAYLRLLVNPMDNESLLRVINEPGRGVGDKTLQVISEAANQQETSLWQVIARIEEYPAYKPAIPRIRDFIDTIEQATEKIKKLSLADTVRYLLERTGYVQHFVEEHTHDSLIRRQNVMELLNAISYFEKSAENPTLSTFLQEISLLTDLDTHDTAKSAVTLMTVHSSKGLEFPIVFVAGLEEDLFPIGGRVGEQADIEEERRLFYVAITRAEKKLYFSFARNRYRFGEQIQMSRSRFLDEIDPSVVRTQTGASISSGSNRLHRVEKQDTTVVYDDPSLTKALRDGDILDHQKESGIIYSSGSGESTDALSIEYDEMPADGMWRTGMVVVHHTFGTGKIIQTEGNGEQQKLTVFFKQSGQKKLLARLAGLKRIG